MGRNFSLFLCTSLLSSRTPPRRYLISWISTIRHVLNLIASIVLYFHATPSHSQVHDMTESPNIDATLLTSSSLSPSLSRLGLELDTVSDFVASMVFLCLRKFVRPVVEKFGRQGADRLDGGKESFSFASSQMIPLSPLI